VEKSLEAASFERRPDGGRATDEVHGRRNSRAAEERRYERMNRFLLIDGNAGNFQLKVRFQHGGSRVLPAADYGVEKQVALE
jgi:hypothetical protein